MKTAMQDLLALVEQMFANAKTIEVESAMNDVINIITQESLEKEKEQIIEAYCDGAKCGANGTKGQHEFGWVSRHTRNKYYNEKYNQNK